MKSKRKASALLREYVRGVANESPGQRRLRIFDFDDTLVVTDTRIWLTRAGGERTAMTPAEFAVYEKQPDDVMDFTEFRQLINPRAIAWTGRMLRQVYDKYGPDGVVILSARTWSEPIQQFLDTAGLGDIETVALADGNPLIKARQVDRWIRERNLDYVEFFDDSNKNVDAVKKLCQLHPNVHIVVRHVIHTHPLTHGFTNHYGTDRPPRLASAG